MTSTGEPLFESSVLTSGREPSCGPPPLAGRSGRRRAVRWCRPNTHRLLARSRRCCLANSSVVSGSCCRALLVRAVCVFRRAPCLRLAASLSKQQERGFLFFAALYRGWGFRIYHGTTVLSRILHKTAGEIPRNNPRSFHSISNTKKLVVRELTPII